MLRLSPILLLFLIVGCTSEISPTPSTPNSLQPSITENTPTNNAISQPQGSESLTPERADILMQAVVGAINEENAAFIVPYMLERDRTEANVQAAIADYRTYFKQPIHQFERTRVEDLGQTNNFPTQRFLYRLSSENGISKDIAIYQDHTGIRLTDEFFLYSFWAKNWLEKLVATLKAEDADQLAAMLSAEDQRYPVAQAQAAIAQYRQTFDLDTLQYEFSGLDSRSFTYRLSGTKSGQPVEHTVQITYGDGLVGLKDDFVPEL